ncbi:RlmE family RNA methyltransferase [Buchnera aphidicola]|uniref:RlmE family RNA methyltransferase n=1 Tax=Buchnera aphidicola TaxID=9 RepID=UPI00346437AE
MKKKRSYSSNRWLSEHFRDVYVKHTHLCGIRSRAWFKLDQINLKYNIFKRSAYVLDLGSSPGSWSQYAIKKIGNKGLVIACDINPMIKIKGVFFLHGDITKPEVFQSLLDILKSRKIDLVMSDMSPNITGISSIDIPNAFSLSNFALNITLKILSNTGVFLIKIFQGEKFKNYLNKIRSIFKIVKICKPHASRNRSRELFILAMNKKNNF